MSDPQSEHALRADGSPTTAGRPSWPTVAGYEILGDLGRGGMGVVYRARQLSLNRLVALKMLSAAGRASPEHLSRFREEARATASLQHPNIVQLYEVGNQDGRPYLALELVDGDNLYQRLAAGLPSAQEAAELVETLARAVHFAHGQRILHRDLKPQNVLLAGPRAGPLSACIPKLTDFGLAKHLETLSGTDVATGCHTPSGAVLGTPNYIAPEQAAGNAHTAGPLVDVYGLGAILYELLTGRPPFQGATPVDTLFQVLSDEPPPPSQFRPGIPPNLEQICLKCLQKDPGQRHASAEALADDLQRFVTAPLQVTRPRPWSRLRALAAALLVLGVGLAAGWAAGFLKYGPALGEAASLRAALQHAEKKQEQERQGRVKAEEEARRERKKAEADADEARRQRAEARKREEALQGDARRARKPLDELVTRLRKERPGKGKEWGSVQRALLEGALQHALGLIDETTTDPARRRAMSWDHHRVANLFSLLGQQDKAETAARRAAALAEELAKADPAEALYRQDQAKHLHNLGLLLWNDRRSPDAEPAFRRAVDLHEQLVRDFPEQSAYRLDLARHLNSLAAILHATDRPGEEAKVRQRNAAVYAGLAVDFPAVPAYRRLQAGNLYHAGDALAAANQPKEAEKAWREALAVKEKLAADFPTVAEYHSTVGASLNDLAIHLRERNELAESRRLLERAVDSQQAALKAAPGDATYRRFLGNHYANLAETLLRQGAYEQAARAAAELPRVAPDARQEYHRAAALLGRCLLAWDRDGKLPQAERQQADAWCERAVGYLREAVGRGFSDVNDLRTNAAFGTLRQREDFKKLLNDLEAKGP